MDENGVPTKYTQFIVPASFGRNTIGIPRICYAVDKPIKYPVSFNGFMRGAQQEIIDQMNELY